MAASRTALVSAFLVFFPAIAVAAEGDVSCATGETRRAEDATVAAFVSRYGSTAATSPSSLSVDDKFSRRMGPSIRPSYKGLITPRIPDAAFKNKLNGSVSTLVAVDEEGAVADVLVVCSSDPMFEQTTINSLFISWLPPATRDGHPVRNVVAIPFQFNASR